MLTLTFLWQASALAISGLPVQQLVLGAGWCHRCPPDHIPIFAERVSPAGVPGGGLSQPPLGLRLETCFVDAVAGGGQPVAIDLVHVFVGNNGSSSFFIPGCKGVTQVSGLCGRVKSDQVYVDRRSSCKVHKTLFIKWRCHLFLCRVT